MHALYKLASCLHLMINQVHVSSMSHKFVASWRLKVWQGNCLCIHITCWYKLIWYDMYGCIWQCGMLQMLQLTQERLQLSHVSPLWSHLTCSPYHIMILKASLNSKTNINQKLPSNLLRLSIGTSVIQYIQQQTGHTQFWSTASLPPPGNITASGHMGKF